MNATLELGGWPIQAVFWLEWDEEDSGGEDQGTSMSAEYPISTRVLCGEI
ncbi:MAG: hypothetical protein ACYCPM_08025 [Acidobacteriaceae bacterium]